MTKIICPRCSGAGIVFELIEDMDFYDVNNCPVCKGRKWIPHPTCSQCEMFYLEDMGNPSKVAKCKVYGIVVHPLGYCHVHSELLEDLIND